MVLDVPVELTVEIGRTTMTIRETLEIGPGAIITLNKMTGEPVDLLVNGRRIARGEVVAIDEEFGLRVTQIIAARPAQRSGLGRAAPAQRASRIDHLVSRQLTGLGSVLLVGRADHLAAVTLPFEFRCRPSSQVAPAPGRRSFARSERPSGHPR